MTVDQDAILRAKVLLLGPNRRLLRGLQGLRAYQVLAEVNPEAYGSKLARVLVEASRSARLAELPKARIALLEEAVAVASRLSPANPYRAAVLEPARDALAREAAAS
jgi:hypothetical protein